MGILRGKTVVVTGSSRGIGYAIARGCASEGASVVVSSRSADAVKAAVESLRAVGFAASGFPCDVSDLSQVEALASHAVEAYGGFDVWVDNAGYAGYYGPTAHVPPQVFAQIVQTNVLGTYHGSLTALRHFLPKHQGKLINLMGRGAREPVPMQNGYASSKAWVRNFTLALAKEYKDSGVGIYAYSPGMVITDMLTEVVVVPGYESELKALPSILRTLGTTPEKAAGKVVWLASPATDHRTGLEVYGTSGAKVMMAFLVSGFRRLLGRPEPPVDLQIIVAPAGLPPSVSRE